VFLVGSQKVQVDLTFRNSGELTSRETTNANGQVVGYDAVAYDGVTNFLKTTTLGVNNPPVDGMYFNFEEISATVPTNRCFDSGWVFHRDVQEKVFRWVPATPDRIGVDPTTITFSPGTAGEGAGNDDDSGAEDETPDSARRILVPDGPAFTPIPQSDHSISPGGIIARRFYAREWLSWGGVRVSPITRWHSFQTLRRKADYSWERKGTNVIALTPDGDSEVPAVTLQEMMDAFLQQ